MNEDGDEILLEDSLPSTDVSYSGTSSNLGSLLTDDGNIDVNSENFQITRAQRMKMVTSYITDEDDIADDKLILEDSLNNGGILTEENGVVDGIIRFDKNFDYLGQPSDNSGFLYRNHRVNQLHSL